MLKLWKSYKIDSPDIEIGLTEFGYWFISRFLKEDGSMHIPQKINYQFKFDTLRIRGITDYLYQDINPFSFKNIINFSINPNINVIIYILN